MRQIGVRKRNALPEREPTAIKLVGGRGGGGGHGGSRGGGGGDAFDSDNECQALGPWLAKTAIAPTFRRVTGRQQQRVNPPMLGSGLG